LGNKVFVMNNVHGPREGEGGRQQLKWQESAR